MKILFVRHGESTDDLSDSFGGWADFELTAKGEAQAAQAAAKIVQLGMDFQLVYTSNLKRAVKTAEVIASALKVPCEETVYLKERNTYGLLTGLVKAEAKAKYPELYSAYEAGQVMGDESVAELSQRIKLALSIFLQKPDQNIVAVTHGKFIGELMASVLGKALIKAHDGGYILVDLMPDGKAELISSSGVEFS